MNYQLIRSANRKTVALQVRNGNVVVRAPYFISEEHIAELVERKTTWLESKLLQQQQLSPWQREFQHGEFLWVRGIKKMLVIDFVDDRSRQAMVVDSAGEVKVSLPKKYQQLPPEKIKAKIKLALESWLKELAQQYIAARLPELIKLTQLTPVSYNVKRYKARWGSCNNRKELSFNYLLVMAPAQVVDYVIVHELCHLKHLNHSSHFWQLVGQYFPDYKAAKNWLKHHQTDLQW